MLGWVVYSADSVSNHAFNWMKQIAVEYGITLQLYFDNEFEIDQDSFIVKGEKEITLPSFVLMRGYCFDISREIEKRGIRVFNSTASMATAEDKMACYRKFIEDKLPQPLTFKNIGCYFESTKLLLNTKFILKSCVGSKGEKVWLIEDEQEFRIAKELCKGDYIIQQYIEDSKGRDIRAWVVGDRVVAAVERYNKDSFKSNIFSGGTATKEEITPELEKICVAASKSIGLDFAGVDILISNIVKNNNIERGYLICEINGNAGFRSAATTSQGEQLLKQMFHYIELTQKRKLTI